jgi:hypothetical protein
MDQVRGAYNSLELLRLEHELVLQPDILLQLKTGDEQGMRQCRTIPTHTGKRREGGGGGVPAGEW